MARSQWKVLRRLTLRDVQRRRPDIAKRLAPVISDLDPLVHTVYPVVMEQAGAREKTPVPRPECTVHWLVHPSLSRECARLEARGHIHAIEEWIRSDAHRCTRWLKENELYASERWKMLNDKDQAFFRDKGWDLRFKNAGIGGIRGWRTRPDADAPVTPLVKLKCLHLHLANLLAAGESIAGECSLAHILKSKSGK